MKKKYFLFLISALLLAFVFVSCDNSGTAADSGVPVESLDDLYATWKKVNSNSDYIEITISSNQFKVDENGITNTFVLNSLDDSTLTLTYSTDSSKLKAKFNEDKTELTLTQTEGNNVFPQHSGTTSFTFTKEK